MWDWRHNKSTARLCGVVAAAGCVCRCAAHTWGCPAAPPHMRACCGACLPTPSLPTHPWSTCVCVCTHLHTYTPTSLLSLPLRALHLEQRVALRTIGHLAQLASGMGFGYGNDCVWDFVVKSRHSTWNHACCCSIAFLVRAEPRLRAVDILVLHGILHISPQILPHPHTPIAS
jgi:hypothetical protein